MDKLMEKMGLYDIWTVFFPGAFLSVVDKSIYDFMLLLPEQTIKATSIIEKIFIVFKMKIYAPENAYELLAFSLCSYFVGLVLHEVSSVFKSKVMYKKGKPIDFLVDSNKGIFEEEQIQKLMPMYIILNEGPLTLNDREKLKKESRNVFEKMNIILQKEKISDQFVKLNVIYNTCATLGIAVIFILCLTFAFEIEFVMLRKFELLLSTISLDLILIVCAYILINRSDKYYRYWSKNIVLAYQELYINSIAKLEE